uniref:Uncharacterized protein n=1 Tax=uncultured Desulfobacterium sp. TaxID=201089 RepID=E1YFE9_9BACT|nr:unknown protein [uncultured Desulfobacterium sp.]
MQKYTLILIQKDLYYNLKKCKKNINKVILSSQTGYFFIFCLFTQCF